MSSQERSRTQDDRVSQLSRIEEASTMFSLPSFFHPTLPLDKPMATGKESAAVEATVRHSLPASLACYGS